MIFSLVKLKHGNFSHSMIACLTAGPNTCMMLPFVQKGGKTMQNGKKYFAGAVRHRHTAMCTQNALGQHLVKRFTIDSEPFPDPRNSTQWNSTAMWTANQPNKALSYTEHAASVNKYVRGELEIIVKKVTHIFRTAGARALDEQGVSSTVSRATLFHCDHSSLHDEGVLGAAYGIAVLTNESHA